MKFVEVRRMKNNTKIASLSAETEAQRLYTEHSRSFSAIDLSVDVFSCGADKFDSFSNLWELFCSSDVLDAMRLGGADEKYVGGDASDYEKFHELCRIMPTLAGNGIYALAHTLLRSLFNCDLAINLTNCEEIWSISADRFFANELTLSDLYGDRGGTVCINVDMLDDPSGIRRITLREGNLEIIPVFCPNSLFEINTKGFKASISALEELAGKSVSDLSGLCDALSARIDTFCSLGCRFASHLDVSIPRFVKPDPYHAEQALKKAIAGKGYELDEDEILLLKAQLCRMLSSEYKKRDMVLQISCNGTPSEQLLTYLSHSGSLGKTVIYTDTDSDPSQLADTYLSIRKNCGIGPDALAYGIQIFPYDVGNIEAFLKSLSRHVSLGALTGVNLRGSAPLVCAAHSHFYSALRNVIADACANGTYTQDRGDALTLAERVLRGNTAEFFGI